MNIKKLFRVCVGVAAALCAALLASCSFAGHIEELQAKIKERHRQPEYTANFDKNNITVNFWVSEDGQILVSADEIEIFGDGRFTAAVAGGGYTGIQWYLQGAPYSSAESVVIKAEYFINGTYRLEVMLYKDALPYSREIIFTVHQ